jgi:DNA-directed RNA polymerase specialized sigma24 family protein
VTIAPTVAEPCRRTGTRAGAKTAVRDAREQRHPHDTADEALVRAVFNEHGRAVLAYATALTGDRRTAEDVLHRTLLHAWRHPACLVGDRTAVRLRLLTVVRDLVPGRSSDTAELGSQSS